MENSILERKTIISDVCKGKPTIGGMRITVETILQFFSAGDSANEILEAYTFLELKDIHACIAVNYQI